MDELGLGGSSIVGSQSSIATLSRQLTRMDGLGITVRDFAGNFHYFLIVFTNSLITFTVYALTVFSPRTIMCQKQGLLGRLLNADTFGASSVNHKKFVVQRN